MKTVESNERKGLLFNGILYCQKRTDAAYSRPRQVFYSVTERKCAFYVFIFRAQKRRKLEVNTINCQWLSVKIITLYMIEIQVLT